ncbi:hypothetical protein JI57_04730 [Psychromonas sp. PRT-SC03]|nr:hypothetical protein JI57_04730 [Psychromonas sp. PRT-SC03]
MPKVEVKGDKNEFIDIETLLEDSNQKSSEEPYSELDLDFSLNDFPDVVDSKTGVDVDNDDNGIGAQLDLARAYLEIDDKAGAKGILLSLQECTDKKQKADILKLLALVS